MKYALMYLAPSRAYRNVTSTGGGVPLTHTSMDCTHPPAAVGAKLPAHLQYLLRTAVG